MKILLLVIIAVLITAVRYPHEFTPFQEELPAHRVEAPLPGPQPEAISPGLIYFTNTREGNNGTGQTVDFYKVNPDGTNLTLIHSYSSEGKAGGNFDVSPDGQKIVFYALEGHDIYLIDTDGGQRVNLTNTPDWEEYDPRWSPDGQQIVYQQNYDAFKRLPDPNNISDLYVMNGDGTDPVNLTRRPPGHESFAASWSPDGQRLLFTSRKTEGFYGSYETYIMNRDGSNQVNLTATIEGSTLYPQWSSDGQRVSFNVEAVTEEDKAEAGYYTVKADGTGLSRLLLPPQPDYEAFHNLKWSPDGQRLSLCGSDFDRTDAKAYSSACTLFTLDLEDANLIQASDDTVDADYTYAWSPDGQWLAFQGALKTEFSTALYVVNIEGTQQRRLTGAMIQGVSHIEWIAIPSS